MSCSRYWQATVHGVAKSWTQLNNKNNKILTVEMQSGITAGIINYRIKFLHKVGNGGVKKKFSMGSIL